MPNRSTYPIFYDDCKQISISFLNKHGYLDDNQCQSGTISWSRDGLKIADISIQVITYGEHPCVWLSYKYNEVNISYSVSLVSKMSNLGKGVVWFFICPNSGKRCRKLHLIKGYFFHRSSFRGCMYKKQSYSHNFRQLDKQFDVAFALDEVSDQLCSKHFKTTYRGIPTKRYSKLVKRLQ
jgi:hypothetical protein